MIAHWDDVPPDRDLAQAARAIGVSVCRIQADPGEEVELLTRRSEDVRFVVSGAADKLKAGDWVV